MHRAAVVSADSTGMMAPAQYSEYQYMFAKLDTDGSLSLGLNYQVSGQLMNATLWSNNIHSATSGNVTMTIQAGNLVILDG
jgi:hypothetical protein